MQTPKNIRIVIVEDHPLVREGLKSLLVAAPDLSVVGETGDADEVFALVEARDPDVLILDVMLPGVNALDIAEQLINKRTRCRVLILSMHAQDSCVRRALRLGAAGYLLMTGEADELQRGVRAVAAGHLFLSAALADRAIVAYASSEQPPEEAEPEGLDAMATLTQRERQVLRLMADGYGNSQIGHRLGISPRTAEAHRAHVMRKLGLQSQTAIVHFAIRRGLIPTGRA